MDVSTQTPKKEEEQHLMPIVVGFPPNYDAIVMALPNVSPMHCFSYDGTIYNPSGRPLTLDLEHHEYIHKRQQEEYGGAEAWWAEYLINADFRLSQEIEAYGEQYAYAKAKLYEADAKARADSKGEKHLGGGVNKILRHALESMATALSGVEYGNLISYGAAESRIKKYGKK